MPAFFYDEQVKRFLLQFARIFSEWEVTFGQDPKGNPILHRVPVIYGDSSRNADAIIAKNSTSNLPSAPQIVYYITAIEYDQTRTQDPTFLQTMNVRQRTFNTETGEYEQTQGNAYTIERIMPVPYTLRVTVDFWTSNYNQKLELFEQLATLFNPSLEIQSTDNFIDWTSLSVVYQDGINWTSRSIPQGNSNPIDIMTWKFYMPIWVSSPIRVSKMNVIQKIIATIYGGNALSDIKDNDLLTGTRQKITPYGYKLLLMGNQLQVLPADATFMPANIGYEVAGAQSTNIDWKSFLNAYGVVRENVSMIALENPYLATEIMGTISFDPDNGSILNYSVDVDTLPQNTLAPVDSIIDPTVKQPGNGLPAPTNNIRYLIVEDIPSQVPYESSGVLNLWPGLTSGASAGSIIKYTQSTDSWSVVFDAASQAESAINFVLNITSGVQYRHTVSDGWMKAVDGYYESGDFRIII